MRFPDFLVIGSMKSATSTVYFDLDTNPGLFFPIDKEPENLGSDAVLTEQGRAEYAAMFARAGVDQRCGEASTGYTKAPEISGVPRRAREICGADLRLIYVMRNPIDRIVSHHYHDFTNGAVGPDINKAVSDYLPLVHWSSYAMQIEAWLEVFDRESLMLVRMEDYVRDRRGNAATLAEHIGVPAHTDGIQEETAFNKSDGKPRHAGLWSVLYHAPVYRKMIRPLVPRGLKHWVFRSFLPKAPPRPAPPSAETVDYLIDRLAEDQERLRLIAGADAPLWDLETARASYAEKRAKAEATA